LINLILEPNNEEYIELFFNEQLDYNGRFQQKPPNIFSKNTDNQWYPCKMIEYGHLNRLINLQVADNKKYYKKEKDEAFFIEKLKESLNRGENEYLDDITEYNQLDL
jgi:hypothetical protein